MLELESCVLFSCRPAEYSYHVALMERVGSWLAGQAVGKHQLQTGTWERNQMAWLPALSLGPCYNVNHLSSKHFFFRQGGGEWFDLAWDVPPFPSPPLPSAHLYVVTWLGISFPLAAPWPPPSTQQCWIVLSRAGLLGVPGFVYQPAHEEKAFWNS